MWQDEIDARLKDLVDSEVTITRNIKTLGLGEASVDEIISEYFGLENPYLGIYSKADGIHLRIIARAQDEAEAREMIAPVENAIHERLAPYIWGYDDETPELSVGAALTARGMTLATMESVSGGFLANTITEAADSDQWYRGGTVAYTPDAIVASGVPVDVLETNGVISQPTANAMALAAQNGPRLQISVSESLAYWDRRSSKGTARVPFTSPSPTARMSTNSLSARRRVGWS